MSVYPHGVPDCSRLGLRPLLPTERHPVTTPRVTETPSDREHIAASASDLLRGHVPFAQRAYASPERLVSLLWQHIPQYAPAHADALRHTETI